MNEKPPGLALVGAGAFGLFCLDAFAAMSEVEVRAVVDADARRARSAANRFNIQEFTTLDDVLALPEIAVIALNTPPHLHARQGLAVIEAGKHLFCEKPLALTLEDGRQMIDRAAEKRVLLTVNYVMRYNPLWQLAAGLREAGLLGDLRHMDLMNHAAGLELPDNHWFWDKGRSGGIWVEHGVHFFDAFALVAGTGGEVIASQQFKRSDGGVDRVEALARYGAAGAHFYHAFDQSAQTERTTVQLTFAKGYMTLHEWVPTSLIIETRQPLDDLQGWITQQYAGLQVTADSNHLLVRTSGDKGSVYRQAIQAGMRQLVQAALHHDWQRMTVTGGHGLHSLAMALAATHERI